MSIVITTPTGNVGGVVANRLIEMGRQVTVIARSAESVADLKKRGARVFVGSHSDVEVLLRATDGAEALFCLTPPDVMTSDVRAHAAVFGEAAAKAIETNSIPHVLYHSGQGADYDGHNAAPLYSLRDNEQRYAAVAKNLICARPSFFMENLLGQIQGLRHRWRFWPHWAGLIFTSFQGSTKIPMIATRDIGERYADILADLDWCGHSVDELHGPGEISHDEIASGLGEVFNRPVVHLRVTRQQMIDAMVGAGMCSAHMANGFYEMGIELEAGRMAFREKRCPENTSATTFKMFADSVLRAAFDSAA